MSSKYKGYKYRQNDSSNKWLFSFVASCDEVKNWAGIPRKSDENVEGFQRPENPDRIIQITEYFNNGESTLELITDNEIDEFSTTYLFLIPLNY